MTGRQPRIWVLLGHRTGDNNQLLALAELLGFPFETRTLRFNFLRVLRPLLGASLLSLTRSSRRTLSGPWPDLVIGIGWRSVPVARWMKRVSGGRTRLVRLGDPRADPGLFDLIITSPKVLLPGASNVVRLPVGMSRYRTAPQPSATEQAFLEALKRPHLLLAVGGTAKYWVLRPDRIRAAAERLVRRAAGAGGSLIMVTSPRTTPQIASVLRDVVSTRSACALVEERYPRFAMLLADADEIFVTGDSVAMTSEAVLAGKPVGLVPIDLDARGRRALSNDSLQRRDLRRFWAELQEQGLIGTIDRPVAGAVVDPTRAAADAVRALVSRVMR